MYKADLEVGLAQPNDLCYSYLDFCVDHLYFPSQIQRNIILYKADLELDGVGPDLGMSSIRHGLGQHYQLIHHCRNNRTSGTRYIYYNDCQTFELILFGPDMHWGPATEGCKTPSYSNVGQIMNEIEK